MILIKKIWIVVLVYAVFVSCNKDPLPPKHSEQTIIMYMPWSTNLTSYLEDNLDHFEEAIKDKASKNTRVIVFYASSNNEATLFEMKYHNGEFSRPELKSYNVSTFTTAEGITSLINDVSSFAPADRYAIIVSAHGLGWLPVPSSKSRYSDQKDYWEHEGVPLTRFFGGLSPEYQIDITTFAKGIEESTVKKMEYILFDDCYMSNIEVAYDLKGVTDYLISSPTEIMAYGFPYDKMGGYLIGDVDYEAIVEEFYSFYNNYRYPYGTIGIVACREVDKMADLMREINNHYDFTSNTNRVQIMDGYRPSIFFDFGDYVNMLCDDSNLLMRFDSQLDKLVPYSAHTRHFYTMFNGGEVINIVHYSGITISDLSLNPKAIETKKETAWYNATH